MGPSDLRRPVAQIEASPREWGEATIEERRYRYTVVYSEFNGDVHVFAVMALGDCPA
jgi:hypothetical protein